MNNWYWKYWLHCKKDFCLLKIRFQLHPEFSNKFHLYHMYTEPKINSVIFTMVFPTWEVYLWNINPNEVLKIPLIIAILMIIKCSKYLKIFKLISKFAHFPKWILTTFLFFHVTTFFHLLLFSFSYICNCNWVSILELIKQLI